jgi:hypothetical protein
MCTKAIVGHPTVSNLLPSLCSKSKTPCPSKHILRMFDNCPLQTSRGQHGDSVLRYAARVTSWGRGHLRHFILQGTCGVYKTSKFLMLLPEIRVLGINKLEGPRAWLGGIRFKAL